MGIFRVKALDWVFSGADLLRIQYTIWADFEL
jgi:hypothetical protein